MLDLCHSNDQLIGSVAVQILQEDIAFLAELLTPKFTFLRNMTTKSIVWFLLNIPNNWNLDDWNHC